MSSTRKKIIESSILLFNSKGLANVRLQDIAEYNKISPGNLTYHFKTKKDLMDYIIYVMIRKLVEIEAKQKKLLNTNFDLYEIFKNHLYFIISYRFFFRDILEILNLVPNAKSVFIDIIKGNEKFIKAYVKIALEQGYFKKESFKEQYSTFAKNSWAIVNSSLTKWEVFDDSKSKYSNTIIEIMSFHYPYLTKKGLDRYKNKKESISKQITKDFKDL
ncbi:MAG: TetR/AcrR family transcriptional regulator [Flavobacteriaceae bacterium]|nr:TetR/AcrR family transcriptional regulator [Flavobacteriaceae bacterium]MBT4415885.1 TetR/AcrR family transcriptional regulator [Flavobacteriaceae bacterium]MBT5395656.1 TetR/AcrR family transcriptional regulator [Flavobacteriaceae bacterium]MBT5596529.1 TetR/AcrR family transcriptional regulator [Flavobacteriaceae bacterium]MBT5858185.1 TetR/AcrR family transcriptional regulator [Flavobacteriaceae bacterium]